MSTRQPWGGVDITVKLDDLQLCNKCVCRCDFTESHLSGTGSEISANYAFISHILLFQTTLHNLRVKIDHWNHFTRPKCSYCNSQFPYGTLSHDLSQEWWRENRPQLVCIEPPCNNLTGMITQQVCGAFQCMTTAGWMLCFPKNRDLATNA